MCVYRKQNGFASIIEVVVTSVVFLIAAVGIFTTLSMLKPHSSDSSTKLKAVYAGRSVIDSLRAEVSAELWNDNNSDLAPGNYTTTINGYDVSYSITDSPTRRILIMDVTFNTVQ